MPGVAMNYPKTVAALATMHGKERVIAPCWSRTLDYGLVMGLDTDRFGTFSYDIARTGSQLDAARAKIAAAFAHAPYASVAIASEGSFGPHPSDPFVPLGRELVLLNDRANGVELIASHATIETNFGRATVTNVDRAIAFAERSKFPSHGVIVIGCVDGRPMPQRALVKDITDRSSLESAVRDVIACCGSAIVETDMRADRNPTRMVAIENATRDLARRFRSRCPACGHPGFDVIKRLAGLPCAWCGEPTRLTRREVLGCLKCRFRAERPIARTQTADPENCDACNP